MTPAWAQRREELLSDCLVSPEVFKQMVERRGEFVVPYQQALETEADQQHVHRYLVVYLQSAAKPLPPKTG
jgi:Ran GTPase-activating protein (RanGAP) involved in mRNA processing and transport